MLRGLTSSLPRVYLGQNVILFKRLFPGLLAHNFGLLGATWALELGLNLFISFAQYSIKFLVFFLLI